MKAHSIELANKTQARLAVKIIDFRQGLRPNSMTQISSLHLTNFRNLNQAWLQLDNKLNLIVGDNAAGKTSIIEALWTLSTGRSFRTSKPLHLISHQQQSYTIFCELTSANQQHKLGLSRNADKVEIKFNGEKISSQSQVAKYLPIQLLTPESHRLLEEGPKARRQFLDWGCFYHFAEFAAAWRDFNRILRQRNQGLKQNLPSEQINLWQPGLVTNSNLINNLREKYLVELTPYIHEYAKALMPKFEAEISLKFYPGWPMSGITYENSLQQNLAKDLVSGHTQYGAHRADIRIKIDGQDPLAVLSRGQQKLFVCSLLLAQAKFHQIQTGNSVIMLIDDLPAELDEIHRATLLDLLDKLEIQHLVTATSKSLITRPGCVIEIQNGTIIQQ